MRSASMRIASLAEAVILQALCDLFNGAHRRESVAFLSGDGFRTASDIAGMSHEEKVEILKFARQCLPKKAFSRKVSALSKTKRKQLSQSFAC